MATITSASVIDAIKTKIELLVGERDGLQRQNGKLEAQIGKLKNENRELVKRAADLGKRLSTLELTAGIASSDGVDKKRAKARVNHLMREVDKCISLLNK